MFWMVTFKIQLSFLQLQEAACFQQTKRSDKDIVSSLAITKPQAEFATRWIKWKSLSLFSRMAGDQKMTKM